MNLIAVAKETVDINSKRFYEVDGVRKELPEDLADVKVITPEEGEHLMLRPDITGDTMCRFSVAAADSFEVARKYANSCVLNFANAHKAGGGFMAGAKAQEEALCRTSTLYASISSETAKEMYKYNNTHLSSVESDYMLYSPNVYVFRDEKCNLLPDIVKVSVITVPAPNRYGAAMFASGKKIEETFIRRIRILLLVMAENGVRVPVLGAWGCGAFGNKPDEVSGYFRRVLVDEGYGKMFDEVCFAIYGSEDGENISAFRKTFEDLI